jgi:N-acetylmuramoyl-L-alanine amidase
MHIVISSGHGLIVRGAAGPAPWGLDEVNEARRVAAELCEWLSINGHTVEGPINDDVSKTQDENLKWIVSQHNAFPAEDRLDVSIHFNAYLVTDGGRGTECLYVSQAELAANVAAEISSASGLINRGAQYRSDLYFLNKTTGARGAILIEICFVDAKTDVTEYEKHFDDIIDAIARAIGQPDDFMPPPAPAFRKIGRVSWFGGPNDMGVSPSEGLALEAEGVNPDDAPELFLDYQPSGTTGLARRLNSDGAHYIAMRWDDDQFSKDELASGELQFEVSAGDRSVICRPADWGPASETGRVCDVSHKTLMDLQIATDDEVEITLVTRVA